MAKLSLSGPGWFRSMGEGGLPVVRAQQDRAFKSWLINFTVQAGWNNPCGNVKQRLLKRKRPPCKSELNITRERPSGNHWTQSLKMISPPYQKNFMIFQLLFSTNTKCYAPPPYSVRSHILFSWMMRHPLNLHWYNDGNLCTRFSCACAGCTLYDSTMVQIRVLIQTDCARCHTTQQCLTF